MKILLAEDDPTFRHLMEEILAMWGYDVVSVRDGSEAWHALKEENAPRLAILDWRMPGMDGIEVCRKIREEVKEPYTYIILLTSQQLKDDFITGMEAGADDYLTKPFMHNELRLRLRAGRRIIELQSELIAAREFQKTKASQDSLTGLWNHEETLRILGQELARADRQGECVSVIMVDIDFFKRINDKYGHLVGDVVLLTIAGRMHSLMRPYDSIGRFGGEEFLIILTECCFSCSVAFAERLRACVENDSVDTSEGLIPVTVSLGVATSDKVLRRDAISLVRAADAALYRAKEKGRNRVEAACEA